MSDRRQYYRIDHPVVIEHQCVSDEEIACSEQPFQFAASSRLTLLARLRSMDADARQHLYRAGEHSASVRACLQLLNRKIELIAQTLMDDAPELTQGEPQFINLSEGGISFIANEPLEHNQALALKLIFTEPRLGLMLYARVTRVDQRAEGFEVAAEFLRMPESCRTQLARMILEAQAQQRQQELNRMQP